MYTIFDNYINLYYYLFLKKNYRFNFKYFSWRTINIYVNILAIQD
jgi:hypothetical protein